MPKATMMDDALASATRLVREAELPPELEARLSRLLAAHWLADLRPGDRFRRSKAAGREARRELKAIRCALTNHLSNPDVAVRTAAEKTRRGIMSGRATWEQTVAAARCVRGSANRAGARRNATDPVRPPLVIERDDGTRWREVVTVRELEHVGSLGDWCVKVGGVLAKYHAEFLKQGVLRYFVHETIQPAKGADAPCHALVSFNVEDNEVVEAKGPSNAPLGRGYAAAMWQLLEALNAKPGDNDDLGAIGVVERFAHVDPDKPDVVRDGWGVWKAEDGSQLWLGPGGQWVVIPGDEELCRGDGMDTLLRMLAKT